MNQLNALSNRVEYYGWSEKLTDLGTVTGTSWSGVTIDWDDDLTTSILLNDMAQVERVPKMM